MEIESIQGQAWKRWFGAFCYAVSERRIVPSPLHGTSLALERKRPGTPALAVKELVRAVENLYGR